ncbi:MAG: hypothetical protein H6686_06740 [Fibrobacteria bacterium]|nr:hypothetical protein [Fibrobacteria bacterium]
MNASRETFQKRCGSGDHERALREVLGREPSAALQVRVEKDNRLIAHNFLVPVDRTLTCDHEGCCESFTIQLVPGQIVYPRWCPFHRPPHRRKMSSVPPRASRSWEDSLQAGGVLDSRSPR